MSPRPTAIATGLAWIVLSPLAFLMAVISTVKWLNVYNVQLLVFGAWATAGVISGIGTLASAVCISGTPERRS